MALTISPGRWGKTTPNFTVLRECTVPVLISAPGKTFPKIAISGSGLVPEPPLGWHVCRAKLARKFGWVTNILRKTLQDLPFLFRPSFSTVPRRGRSKRGRTQKHANARKRAQTHFCKSAQKSGKGRKRALARKNCKQPGLGIPNSLWAPKHQNSAKFPTRCPCQFPHFPQDNHPPPPTWTRPEAPLPGTPIGLPPLCKNYPWQNCPLVSSRMPWVEDWYLSSPGIGRNCTLPMRVQHPSPVLDKNCAAMDPEILSSTRAGVWRKAPKAFPELQFCTGKTSVCDWGQRHRHSPAQSPEQCPQHWRIPALPQQFWEIRARGSRSWTRSRSSARNIVPTFWADLSLNSHRKKVSCLNQGFPEGAGKLAPHEKKVKNYCLHFFRKN